MTSNSQPSASSQSSSLHSNIPSTSANSLQNNSSVSNPPSYRSLNTNQLSSALPSSNLFIYGTNIRIQFVISSFQRFVTSSPHSYKTQLEERILREDPSFDFDLAHLYAFDPVLYFQIVQYPLEMMKALDSALVELFYKVKEENPSWPLPDEFQLQARPFGAKVHPTSTSSTSITSTTSITSDKKEGEGCLTIRDLGPRMIDSLVTIKGLVVRVSSLIPDMVSASYKCELCGRSQLAEVTRDAVLEPRECVNEFCRERNCLLLDSVASAFGNKQIVKIQEAPESIPKGETPLHLEVSAHDALVDSVRPGDRVEVTGVYRLKGAPLSSRRREIASVYRTFLDAVYFLKPKEKESSSLQADTFKQLGSRSDIRELLQRSLAPAIFGMEDAKLGLLCQLFGGSSTTRRSEIHVILCGDPGTSKSQLIQQAHRLSPRGVYTSGKGSSAVGLSAHVTKSPETGEVILESGALVLADRGLCCIDEFDKMGETAKTILHEAMEQQTVSLAKAGIVCSLHSRTSVLAAANPRESRYNPRQSVVQNLQMPPSLLSRFDLVFLVLDKADEERDGALGSHLLSLFSGEEMEEKDILDPALFRGYVQYARENVKPVLNEEASERAVQAYLELRGLGSTYNKNVITATPRQLESLLRIAEAMAKMRLSEEVTKDDVEDALRLVKSSTHSAATDPKTGLVDIDLLITGRSAMDRETLNENIEVVKEIIDEMKDKGRNRIQMQLMRKIFEDKSERNISNGEMVSVLKHLEMEEEVKIETTDKDTVIFIN